MKSELRHLDFDHLFNYPSGNMEDDNKIEKHLETCSECMSKYMNIQRTQILLLRSAEKLTKKVTSDKRPDCPDEQLIANYVEKVLLKNENTPLSQEERNMIAKHLEECDFCLNLVLSTYQMLWEMRLDEADDISDEEQELQEELEEQLQEQMQEIATRIYAYLVASYILRRPYIKRGRRAATENRLVHENEDFRWEVYQDRTSLILSIVTKSDNHIGNYVTVNVISANKVEYNPKIIQWEQQGPMNIGSENPIDSGGRVEIVVAETKLDMENDGDFELLEHIFEEIELKMFEKKIKE